jgi:hypothetical protein
VNRAHRIGAAGAVTVTRYLAADTIEERIDEVLRKKRDLSELILSQSEPSEAGRTGLTVDELFALFKLPTPGRSAAALAGLNWPWPWPGDYRALRLTRQRSA